MTPAERRKIIKDGVAWLAAHDADVADDDRATPFQNFAELIAYQTAVARELGVDESIHIEIALGAVPLFKEELIEAAAILKPLGYQAVSKVLRRLARTAAPYPPCPVRTASAEHYIARRRAERAKRPH